MQQTLEFKVFNLFQEKLEERDAFDEGGDMNESEHSDELFDFLNKTCNNTCRDSATKIFESFVDLKLQRKISSSTV